MTSLLTDLTDREISDATRLADMRRRYHRRKGEINGPFSWDSVIDTFVWIVILAALFCVCFLGGRWFEAEQRAEKVHPASIATEYKDFRIRGNH